MTKQPLTPKPGSTVDLRDFAPDYHGDYHKKDAREAETELEARLAELQEMLYAQGKYSLLIVLQAMDAGGKDGTIKHVFDSVNPQGVRVTSFKAPTSEELSHDFLWRIHQHTPPKGYIGIFNRSHYEDVLVVRVNNLVPADVWKERYDHINHFERLLAESGTRILKFFLHISKEEQKARFEERLARPDKHWKFSTGDLPVREQWNAYMEAYEAALTRCNTEYAPWHIVPANRKWYRNFIISKTIVETLEDMNLAYPDPEPGLDKIVIPD
ncbi:MAG: polyphosphate kinase 2 family protein [Anaerolineaceae bacterium]|nr:polyphosphate kinase 2 family protein [Anaerolineaceae bacterium]